jgi:hypothetical protein
MNRTLAVKKNVTTATTSTSRSLAMIAPPGVRSAVDREQPKNTLRYIKLRRINPVARGAFVLAAAPPLFVR